MRSSICAVLLLCSSMTAYAKDNDLEVLAEFDDSKLTVEEFARREANLLSWAGISAGVDQIQARVEDLVFDSVAATKARSTGVAEDPDVQLQVNRILKAAFIKKEMPRDEIDVTNEEIEKFYQDNKERYRLQADLKSYSVKREAKEPCGVGTAGKGHFCERFPTQLGHAGGDGRHKGRFVALAPAGHRSQKGTIRFN